MARMRRKFADSRKAAANEAAARRREDYMATQGRNIVRKAPDESVRRGLLGDIKALVGYDKIKDTGPVRNLTTMGGDLRDLAVSPFKPSFAYIADALASGIGAFKEGERARRDDDEWTWGGDELDITRGTPAYKWLLDDIIQPEYRDDFRREVKKNNLHWTELNKYAGDKAVGLAPRINLLNDPSRFEDYTPVQQANYLGSILDPDWKNVSTGIEDSAAGRRALDEYVNAGVAMEGEGIVGDAAADAAEFYGRATFLDPREKNYRPITPVTINRDVREYDTDISDAQDLINTLGTGAEDPTIFRPRQEGLDWDFDSERKMRLYLDQQEKDLVEGHIPTIDEIAGTSYEPPNYTQVNPGDLPPFLGGDTDWWTPEPKEEDLRGWDWINDPVMKHYGGGRPSKEIEREWPNTPPPGYGPPPPWYNRAWDWMKEGDWPTY